MRGLEAARQFFLASGVPLVAATAPEVLGTLAAGLVGEGSECLNVDDDLSQDHDWGAGFCLWLRRDLFERYGEALGEGLRNLEPPAGLPSRFRNLEGPNDGRVGVFPIDGFFQRFTGLDRPPEAVREWWAIPETNLATATNGAVFCDRLGAFSRWRDELARGCPADVQRKRLAFCCYLAHQAGPYNRPRAAARNFAAAAALAEAAFTGAALRIVYLLNGRYAPFYKWLHPLVRDLPVLGRESFAYGDALARIPFSPAGTQAEHQKAHIIAGWCDDMVAALVGEGLARPGTTDLYDAARQIHGAIEEPWLRAIPLEASC